MTAEVAPCGGRASEGGQVSQNQGEDRSDYWRVREDIEVKIGGCEGEARETKIWQKEGRKGGTDKGSMKGES